MLYNAGSPLPRKGLFMLLPVVKLKTPRNSRHPWIFRKMIQAPRGLQLEAGSLVEVRDKAGGFVGRAFYHPENTIALRLLTENREEEIDADFFAARLATTDLVEIIIAVGGQKNAGRC